MPTTTPWPAIHAERAALADDLATLTDAQWASPSLCPGWTVLDVLGHMTSTAKLTPVQFLTRMVASGFRFGVMTRRNIDAETSESPAATLAEFRRVHTSTTAPPGPVDTWLGETIVHAEDIRRPLGIAHRYPTDAVARAC
jgi:uncharacterized protein (TIGR03083 family)